MSSYSEIFHSPNSEIFHSHHHGKNDCSSGEYIPSFNDLLLSLKNPNKIFKIETPSCVYEVEFVCKECSVDEKFKNFVFKRIWKDVLRKSFLNEQKTCSSSSSPPKSKQISSLDHFLDFIKFIDDLNLSIQKRLGISTNTGFDVKIFKK